MRVMERNTTIIPSDAPRSLAGFDRAGRWGVAAMLCAALLLILTARQAYVRIAHSLIINHVAGAWTTLAADAAAGTLYRSTVTPDAFGGTRFAPLYIQMQASLIRIGVEPLSAGHVLNVLFAIILAAGVVTWMRRLGSGWPLALALGGTIFGTETVRSLLSDIRGDTLAASLCIWALALWQRDAAGKFFHWSVVGILFALAWTTKLTSVYGIAATVLVGILDGRRREAFYLGFTAVVLAVLIFTAAQVASHGRMMAVFADCASGGMTLKTFLKAPLTFLWILENNDPLGLIVFAYTIPALAALVVALRARPRGEAMNRQLLLPAVALTLTLLITFVIFASPGTNVNHMIDLQMVGWVALAAALRSKPVPLAVGLITFCLIGAGAIWLQADNEKPSRRDEMGIALAAAGAGDQPVLAENPSVLQLGHEPVYMLDSFMFHVAAVRDPNLINRLRRELQAKKFRGVILMNDPRTEFGSQAIERTHFYPGFCIDLLANYSVAFAGNDNVTLVPRP